MMGIIWATIAIAGLGCMIMCIITDAEGDVTEAWGWGAAAIAIGVVALVLYCLLAWPAPGKEPEPERPIVYDQSIETRM